MIGLAGSLVAAAALKAPYLDYHALAPEIVLTSALCLMLTADLFLPEDRK